MSEPRMRVAEAVNDRGVRLFVDPADTRGAEVIAKGADVNPGSRRLWNILLGLQDWPLVIDVGANYGEMIAGGEIVPSAEVIAFEPNPRVVPYLQRTLREFGRPVELVTAAVSDRAADHADFIQDLTWSGMSGLSEPEEGAGHSLGHIQVPVVTLDGFFAERPAPRAFCLKIDVEGNEPAVLAGAAGLLDATPEWAVLFEIKHDSDKEVAELARRYALFLADERVGTLIRATPKNVGDLLRVPWLSQQDAVLMSHVVADRIPAVTLAEAVDRAASERERVVVQLSGEIAAARKDAADLRSSTSWKVSAPVRWAGETLSRLRGIK